MPYWPLLDCLGGTEEGGGRGSTQYVQAGCMYSACCGNDGSHAGGLTHASRPTHSCPNRKVSASAVRSGDVAVR